ncbi:hypothetical protein ACOME3_009162 [Neoechinorhynchus agilis]
MIFDVDKLSLSKSEFPDEVILAKSGNRIDNVGDCASFCDQLLSAKVLKVVRMEGNSIGEEAAKSIGNCLSKRKNEIERLIMNDIFTGRSKDELPFALSNLLDGINECLNLVEINLSLYELLDVAL